MPWLIALVVGLIAALITFLANMHEPASVRNRNTLIAFIACFASFMGGYYAAGAYGGAAASSSAASTAAQSAGSAIATQGIPAMIGMGGVKPSQDGKKDITEDKEKSELEKKIAELEEKQKSDDKWSKIIDAFSKAGDNVKDIVGKAVDNAPSFTHELGNYKAKERLGKFAEKNSDNLMGIVLALGLVYILAKD